MRWPELPVVAAHGELVPDWLTARDAPWLRELGLAATAMAGATRNQAARRLLALARDPRAGRRGPFAAAVLAASLPVLRVAGEPAALRLALAAASSRCDTPDAARAVVAAQFGLSVAQLPALLLADLPGERLVRAPGALAPSASMLAVNRELARRLLLRAVAARLTVRGHAARVVRQLQLADVAVQARASGDDVVLDLVEATARRRLGGALRGLLDLLPWCQYFQLRVRLRGGEELVLGSGDPLPAGAEPRAFDSRLEAVFAREFAALAPEWRLLREPRPVRVDGGLQFPDFELRHDDGRRLWLEIAAWWRPGYLQRKLALLRQLGERLLLCVEDSRPEAVELPAEVLRFRRRLDAACVLREVLRRLGDGR